MGKYILYTCQHYTKEVTMNHDWNFEPNEQDECTICANEGRDECECGDPHEPDTIEEYNE